MNITRTKIRCELCGQEISSSNYSRHLDRHKNRPESFRKTYNLDHEDLCCKFCGKELKNTNSLIQHEMRCSHNPSRLMPSENFAGKGVTPWNKGLNKDTDDRVLKNAQSISNATMGRAGRPHTQEEKDKISAARIRFLRQNPNKVPYKLNHSSSPSFPELYFKELFEKENINLRYHKQIGPYELDFYNENKMIDLEIDGDQHYLDPKISKSDKRRTEYLTALGWAVYRIRWSSYKKMSDSEKKRIIEHIRQLVD